LQRQAADTLQSPRWSYVRGHCRGAQGPLRTPPTSCGLPVATQGQIPDERRDAAGVGGIHREASGNE
jgi:hypothetical protein